MQQFEKTFTFDENQSIGARAILPLVPPGQPGVYFIQAASAMGSFGGGNQPVLQTIGLNGQVASGEAYDDVLATPDPIGMSGLWERPPTGQSASATFLIFDFEGAGLYYSAVKVETISAGQTPALSVLLNVAKIAE